MKDLDYKLNGKVALQVDGVMELALKLLNFLEVVDVKQYYV